MTRMLRAACGALLLASLRGVPAAAAPSGGGDLERGLSAYMEGDWRSAVLHLKRAAAAPGGLDEDTLFLLIRSEVNAGERELALADCEEFLRLHDASAYRPLVLFTDGKLLGQLGRGERAVLVLSDFCHRFPAHELYPEALFCMGEAFLADYDFATARSLYARVAESYPTSSAAPGARARLDEISRREREEKLLYLLKVTGEENLSTREDYERQLRRYQAEDKMGVRRQLADARSRADELERELAALRASGAEVGNTERVAPPEGFEPDPEETDGGADSAGPAVPSSFSPSSVGDVPSAGGSGAASEVRPSGGRASGDPASGGVSSGNLPSSAGSGGAASEASSSGGSASGAAEIPASAVDGEAGGADYERELEGLRRKARRIQQIMDERQFGDAR